MCTTQYMNHLLVDGQLCEFHILVNVGSTAITVCTRIISVVCWLRLFLVYTRGILALVL